MLRLSVLATNIGFSGDETWSNQCELRLEGVQTSNEIPTEYTP